MIRVFCLLLLVSAAVLAADPKAIVEKQFAAIKTTAVKNPKDLSRLFRIPRTEGQTVDENAMLLEIATKATFTVLSGKFMPMEWIEANIKVEMNGKVVEKHVLLTTTKSSSTGYTMVEFLAK